MIKLGVNVDHVATLRQARRVDYPDPVVAALLAERAGAKAITVHLREDRRHIRDDDLARLRDAIHIHLNQEMAPVAEMVEIAIELRPNEVCLVPERREEITTEGGLDAAGLKERLAPIIERLKMAQVGVSLFVDPEVHQIEAAAMLGADFVELHTGAYANLADADTRRDSNRRDGRRASGTPRTSTAVLALLGVDARRELEKIALAVTAARELKLRPNAGHGLNYRNVAPVAALAGIQWLHIGHAIVARAVEVGMERAVREMKALLDDASRGTHLSAKARRRRPRVRG
ncbi:MAG: pyridoxine 5'-phosphate synthase [Candidatus Binataceae bacterium]